MWHMLSQFASLGDRFQFTPWRIAHNKNGHSLWLWIMQHYKRGLRTLSLYRIVQLSLCRLKESWERTSKLASILLQTLAAHHPGGFCSFVLIDSRSISRNCVGFWALSESRTQRKLISVFQHSGIKENFFLKELKTNKTNWYSMESWTLTLPLKHT